MALPPETTYRNRQNAKKPELKFEPLSDGLGFHPFSDGLPYAPIGKTSSNTKAAATSQGTGAVAAGKPSFTPPPTPPRIQAPRLPTTPFAHPKPRVQVQQQPQKPVAPTAQAIAAQLTPELLQPEHSFVYTLKRALAYLLDSSINLGLCAGALSIALWKQDLSPELLLNPGVVLVAGLFVGFFNWAITTAEEVAFGTSIGKRLFGLAIQGGASAIFLRAFFFVPSLCFGGIGLLWALFDRRRRCWHDLVVDIQPIEIARL